MISPDAAAAIVIASFAVFMGAAQLARLRAVARRGGSLRRVRGIGDAAAYFFWLPYLVLWVRPGPTIVPPAGLVALGLVLAVSGIVFALWAMTTLGRHYDLTLEVHGGHELVRRGPYAVVRHPIYTGLAVHSLGACCASGNVLFVAGTLAITFPIFVVRARAEERLMREAFGAEYDRYATDVPMLIPRPRRRLPLR